MLDRVRQIVRSEKFGQFVRFCIVGVIAAGIHYGIYYLLLPYLPVNVAYSAGYFISLCINFVLTTYVTFTKKPSVKKAFGFATSHAINYALHIIVLNIYLYFGMNKLIAPVAVILTVMPINFAILRWVFTREAGHK